MTDPFKEGHYWRDKSPDWEIRLYSEAVHGKGDLGSNTCKKIISDKDTSPWAYDALYACQDLLLCGVRWPRYMIQGIDAKTRIGWRWSQVVWKRLIMDNRAHLTKFGRWCERVGLPNYVKFRFRGQLTRDPYTAFYTACLVLGRPELIEDTLPVWRVYQPAFWSWYRYLCTKDEKHLKRYRFWNKFSTSQKDYVIRLRALRELAIQYRNTRNDEN